MDDPTDIFEQESRQEAAKEKQRLIQLGTRADVMWLMSDRRGRNIVARILDSTGVMSASFTSDTHVTAHLEGKRAVGIALLNQLQTYTPREYVLMLNERLFNDEESNG